jgi:DNA-binding GntR family transcriptional regulator
MGELDFLDADVRTSTMTDVVFRKLEKAILEGQFKGGQILSTEAIRKKLQVSRMPVREAFRKLEAEELVEIHPQKGVVVSAVSYGDFQELREIRLELEKFAFRKVIENATEEDIRLLEEIIEREERAQGDVMKALTIRNEFHYAVHRVTHNDVLIKTLRKLYGKYTRYIYLHAHSIRQEDSPKYSHRRLLEAIKKRDIPYAMETVEQHEDYVGREILDILRRKDDG